MPDPVIRLGELRIRYDRACNIEIYKTLVSPGPETCGCENCRVFVQMRNRFYPSDLRELLAELGIDYRKEVEVVTYVGPGLPPLEGWYNFVGHIEAGEQTMHCLDSGFQIEVSNGGLLVQREFESHDLAKLEWRWLG